MEQISQSQIDFIMERLAVLNEDYTALSSVVASMGVKIDFLLWIVGTIGLVVLGFLAKKTMKLLMNGNKGDRNVNRSPQS